MSARISKGQKVDLTKNQPGLRQLIVGMGWQTHANPELDTAVFLLGANGKAAGDEDFVFYGHPRHKSGAVAHVSNPTGGDQQQVRVDLGMVPASVERLAFTATIYDADARRQNFGQVTGAYIRLVDAANGAELLRYELGAGFSVETAIVVGELYRYQGAWKFSAVGAGFRGGLAALCRNFGIEVSEGQGAAPPPMPVPPPKPPVPPPAPQHQPLNLGRPAGTPVQVPPAPSAAPPPKKVELKKGQKVSLVKGGGSLGEIAINLNWNRQPQKKGGVLGAIFGSGSGAIDLDLGCLFEMKNGDKGCVQALGNAFGSLGRHPWIALDGDDRTGSNAAGETLRVNGAMAGKIKRILVFTFIYQGAANWQQADGIVTVRCPGSPDIVVRMDEYGSALGMCAIALLENHNDTFSVEKLVRFFSDHRSLDRAYGWGMRWTAGRKD